MNEKNDQVQHYVNLQLLHNQVEELFSMAEASDFIDRQNLLVNSFLKQELEQQEQNPEHILDVLFMSDQLKLFLVKLQELM